MKKPGKTPQRMSRKRKNYGEGGKERAMGEKATGLGCLGGYRTGRAERRGMGKGGEEKRGYVIQGVNGERGLIFASGVERPTSPRR